MAQQTPPVDRYHPQMPAIPGVPSSKQRNLVRTVRTLSIFLSVTLLAGGAVLVVRHHAHVAAAPTPSQSIQVQDPPAADALSPPPTAPEPSSSTGEIAPLSELAKPWSSKAFTFVRPLSHESIAALVVRLPAAAPGSAGAFWAFSQTEPFGTCQLAYVTDLAILANQYGYAAKHPMVVDPCTQTVFDPLRMGQRSDGAWIRGAIVQGGGLRPPIAIEVSVRGNVLYADRAE
jgi:hypothetical protein